MIGIIGDGPNPSSPEENDVAGKAEESRPGDADWILTAEELLGSLRGVMSTRVVARPDGFIEEIHILTTEEVSPKQTVRNVESALLARYDVTLDHRKISVAQTTARPPKRTPGPPPARQGVPPRRPAPLQPTADPPEGGVAPPPGTPPSPVESREPIPEQAAPTPKSAPESAPKSAAEPMPEPPAAQSLPVTEGPAAPTDAVAVVDSREGAAEERLLFLGHTIESLRTHRLNMKVALEWRGERCVGDASGADLARARLEGFALATLRAMEAALHPDMAPTDREGRTLTLDGVKLVEAFDRRFVLVAVNALLGGEITRLTGAAAVNDSKDRAVILATLQATDRRVRAALQGTLQPGRGPSSSPPSPGPDPFDVWA